ncbi:MAG: triose-phosphate isomerase [Clostridia bacterium]|nr:triose-phosphate isomerase [Clostridia bacterium]
MRKKIIAGNWKMNYTASQAEDFLLSILDLINTDEVDVVVCPNYTALDRIQNILDDKKVKLGAQNVYFEPKGAYTGEISVDMLNALNVEYCIVGHSERRQYFNETNLDVNKKVKVLIEKGIKPILCVGETLEERNENKLFEKVELQIKEGLLDVSAEDVKNNVVIAYEPIWAIGTGVTATSAQAEEMCAYIRKVIAQIYGENVSESVRIQYGGSVNAKNANELLNMDNIDGALVGGAALTNDFVAIVNYEN